MSRVAVIFGLVVNFGSDEQAAEVAREVVRDAGQVKVRDVPFPLGDPFVTRINTGSGHYIEFSVYPYGLGFGRPGPKPSLDPRSLTREEISGVGDALYEILHGFSAYRAAIVGWNTESLVDVDDLESDWQRGEPPDYDGLVLSDDLYERWGLGSGWLPFDDGHHWFPYSGSENFW